MIEDKTEEMEALQAELVLANSRIAEYEAAEAARVEAERMVLVERATDLGMSGHEDLSTPTLETLIASWEASHPEPTPVEMTPVESVEKPVEASMPGGGREANGFQLPQRQTRQQRRENLLQGMERMGFRLEQDTRSR